MNRPDKQLCRDLDSLYKTDARFQRVVEWITQTLHSEREVGDDAENVHALLRSQGKCIMLKDFLEHIQTAEQDLLRYDSHEKTPSEGTADG